MSEVREFSLEPVRTDGWFERIGEGIASFQALCEIIGPKFFAFAMIGGARITALTVDRTFPDNTLVDFVVGAEDDEVSAAGTQQVTLPEFRRRLGAALAEEEPVGPPAKVPATSRPCSSTSVCVICCSPRSAATPWSDSRWTLRARVWRCAT